MWLHESYDSLVAPVFALLVLVLVAGIVVWVAALACVLVRGDSYEGASQLVWALVVLLAGPVGAVLYFLLARRNLSTRPPREPIPDRQHRAEAITHPWSDDRS